jgi:hypothetical protein
MTSAEELTDLRQRLAAKVAELRAYARRQSQHDPLHRGIAATALDIADEIEAEFVTPKRRAQVAEPVFAFGERGE